MKLLITGGAGRLGAELVRLTAASGYTARAFDLPQAPLDIVEDIPGVETFPGDISNLEDVTEVCQGIDGVFHLAALLPPKSERNREETMRVNVEGTLNLLETLKQQPNVHLIFASSVATYGITASEEPPIKKTHPLRAHNNYSESKIEAENLIKRSDIPYTILRISAITIADLVELPDVIPYREDQRVEFIYVSDSARALLSSFEMSEAQGQIYNIAGGTSWQVTGGKFIQLFYEALGVEVEPRFAEIYTALDWYDTSRSHFLGYQRANLNRLLNKLKLVGERLGLR